MRKDCKQMRPTEEFVGGMLCRKCTSERARITAQQRRKEVNKLEAGKALDIIKAFIDAWEYQRTKSIFECIYIDCCKLLGKKRKRDISWRQ